MPKICHGEFYSRFRLLAAWQERRDRQLASKFGLFRWYAELFLVVLSWNPLKLDLVITKGFVYAFGSLIVMATSKVL